MTAADLDDLVLHMLTPASRLVEAVHTGNRELSHSVLGGLSPVEYCALCIALAALVPVGDVAASSLAMLAGQTPRTEK